MTLTQQQISDLESRGCTAENWADIIVSDDFSTSSLRNVHFYGHCAMGSFAHNVKIDGIITKPCGITNATLHNVTLGDACLIENVHGYISNVAFGNGCLISNVGIIKNEPNATFAEGEAISVLNEGGDGNVVLTRHLTAQVAWLTTRYPEMFEYVQKAVKAEGSKAAALTAPNNVTIVGVKDIIDTRIEDGAKLTGCTLLENATILSSLDAPTKIGHDVILENSIVAKHATIENGAKLDHCFVGETVHIGKGASAEASVFFANAYLDNGEACAAYCGPFATSHHKSTLLIGGDFSFYNAGSNTNQSNHAYKMGPIHWGVLERGSKTASGCHILWPATVGTFSMVMGKVQSHPDTRNLPFSYLIAEGRDTNLVPGINLCTVGTWRDVGKWPKRDKRPASARQDIINFAFPNPLIIQEVITGKKLLTQLLADNAEAEVITYNGCNIRRRSIEKGIKYYDLAILLYINNVKSKGISITKDGDTNCINSAIADASSDSWVDLSGMLAPASEINALIADATNGKVADIPTLLARLSDINSRYDEFDAAYAQHVLSTECAGIADIDTAATNAYKQWVAAIHEDALKEHRMGDVEEGQINDFLASLPE